MTDTIEVIDVDWLGRPKSVIKNDQEFNYVEGGLCELRDDCLNFIQPEWDKANDDSPLDIFIEEGMGEEEINDAQFHARQHWLEKYLIESNKIYVDESGHGPYVNVTLLTES